MFGTLYHRRIDGTVIIQNFKLKIQEFITCILLHLAHCFTEGLENLRQDPYNPEFKTRIQNFKERNFVTNSEPYWHQCRVGRHTLNKSSRVSERHQRKLMLE